MATAFVTGGSGFIGGRLIMRLVEDGHTVRALARTEGAAARVAELGAEPLPGDLSDLDALVAAAEGADLAFHAAAWTGPGGTMAEFTATNVDGTRNVIAACRKAGVRRLVHVGTEAALMAGQPLVDVTESAPLRPDSPAPYPATKALAEQLVRSASTETLETVVVRPRFVWGAGDTSVLPELVAAVRVGRFVWIGGGMHLTDTTHVDNAVEGLVLAAERGQPGEAYFVTDGEPVVFREFVSELLDTQGVPAPRRSLPLGVARLLAEAGERVWKVLRRPGAPPLDYFTLWASGLQCTINIDKARTELGYVPVRTREEGFAELRA
ncbi:MAG TPA: NAD-dependent epimerase/dehydratase family protein [Actinophytocola sp.]|uniref:NAD-dependent epimerase/dehydratase family protein n=1 Tax=Actinophytocola sp. TaxID=1872138 RepID=UPI002DDD466C|nr:NAD-dependent epimerase/dehydratase family protein [Actinophytocola sp.]HEV2780189.1 NAD-dependent epimerase/dehydratase family protein [Actinophytocola sp.]